MKKIASLLLTVVLLLPGLAAAAETGAETRARQPLETWGIKTADYQKVARYWSDDDNYNDVPPPQCGKASAHGMKLLCSREDFQKLAWYTRRFFIYAEENATKRPIDHNKAYAEVYQTRCKSEACLGRELKQQFYQSLEDSGMGYILEDEAN